MQKTKQNKNTLDSTYIPGEVAFLLSSTRLNSKEKHEAHPSPPLDYSSDAFKPPHTPTFRQPWNTCIHYERHLMYWTRTSFLQPSSPSSVLSFHLSTLICFLFQKNIMRSKTVKHLCMKQVHVCLCHFQVLRKSMGKNDLWCHPCWTQVAYPVT